MNMEDRKEYRTITQPCQYCNKDFSQEVLCYSNVTFNMPMEYVRKECRDCDSKMSQVYTVKKSGLRLLTALEDIRSMIDVEMPHNHDRQLVMSYLDIIQNNILPIYFSQEKEIERLYMTGNFMIEELATFYNMTKEEIKEIVRGCNIHDDANN